MSFVGADIVTNGRVVSIEKVTLSVGEKFQLSSTRVTSNVVIPSGRAVLGVKL